MIMEIFILFIIISLFQKVYGVCYFPLEYQGIFSTQSGISAENSHKYLQITILPDAIPVWGVCYEMNGPLVILHDSTGGEECFRCFHVTLQSPNVFQIYTERIDKCYLNNKSAKYSCPTVTEIKNKIAREIMLYKSRSFTQEGSISKQFCPFNGKYFFTYNINDGTEDDDECPNSKSLISNCPSSSELQLSFRECRFENMNMTLRCLGDWKGMDGKRYFALWDTHVTSESQPQYRCAMYQIDSNNGRIFIAFSVDSSCTNRLYSPLDGYETMVLTPLKKPSPPAPVHTYSCIFPQWSNGKWKDIEIKGRILRWRDAKGDKVYESLCLTRNSPNQERFALYSLNQCGDDKFTCIWIKKRDRDVMEFKIASVQYNYFSSSQICSDDVFIGQIWNTQGRLSESNHLSCLVIGEYVGVLPDNPSLCAQLTTDCRNPSLKHFKVYACKNASDSFENRYYRCLGQWKENGIMYTYTYRVDVHIYECFAGVLVSENEAFIIEAGSNCERGLHPLAKGMKLIKQSSCSDYTTNSATKFASATTISPKPAFPAWWPSTSRRPWNKRSTTMKPKSLWEDRHPEEFSRASVVVLKSFPYWITLLLILIDR